MFLNVSIILFLSHSTSAGESAKKKKKSDRLKDRLLQKTDKNKLKIFMNL